MHVTERAAALVRNAKNVVILDTETTGLGTQDEVIELAVINLAGEPLINQRFRPTAPINERASEVHGLYACDLEAEPWFSESWQPLRSVLASKTVVAYNAKFDKRMLEQTCWRYRNALPLGAWATHTLKLTWRCLMNGYTEYNGNERVTLATACAAAGVPPGDHSALADCRAALGVLHWLASKAEAKTKVAA